MGENAPRPPPPPAANPFSTCMILQLSKMSQFYILKRLDSLQVHPYFDIHTAKSVVCYTAIFSVVTQSSSPQTAAEN